MLKSRQTDFRGKRDDLKLVLLNQIHTLFFEVIFVDHVQKPPAGGIRLACEAIAEVSQGFFLEDVYFITTGIVAFDD
jgi:hypothetical protein